MHKKVFGKCAQIWDDSRLPKDSGLIRDHQFIYPVCNRWNSFFDCTKQLHQFGIDTLNPLLFYTKSENTRIRQTHAATCFKQRFLTRKLQQLLRSSVLYSTIFSPKPPSESRSAGIWYPIDQSSADREKICS